MKINKSGIVFMISLMTIIYSCGSGVKGNNNLSNGSEIKSINDMENFNEYINGSTPVLVDFYADWCAPCKMMAPIMQQVSREMEGQLKVIKVDVDKNEEVARKYQIRSIPTMILFKNGKVLWQGVGVMQAYQIKAIVKKNS
ncbi:MAG TPA: thioredoxin [Prolixibacteraceae bacterium]|jgi:thioredoxin 1